jgi:hypothetical protein
METNDVQFSKTAVRGARAPATTAGFLDQLAGLVRTGAELSSAGVRPVLVALGLSGGRKPRKQNGTARQQTGAAAERRPTTAVVNPRIRAYGKARLDMARRMQSQDDWERLWVAPRHPFPFRWREAWKYSFEYTVDEFAAEVGFFIDVLGFPVTAIGPDYAMFTSPDDGFHFAVVPTPPDGRPTPPDTVCMQFMVADIVETAAELESRGVVFESRPRPVSTGSRQLSGYFRTPNGICVDLWGHAPAAEARPARQPATRQQLPLAGVTQDGPASPQRPAKTEAGKR